MILDVAPPSPVGDGTDSTIVIIIAGIILLLSIIGIIIYLTKGKKK